MGNASNRNTTVRKWAAVLLVAMGLGAAAFIFLPSNSAHARAALGKTWPASNRISMNEIDHSRFDALLKKFVDGDGYVDYTRWKASAVDRKSLHNYLDELSRADRRKPARREAKLAFWINAYNAVTLEGILREYPTSSIRQHTSRLGGYNIWKHLPLRVGDEAFSLEQIEHDLLRPMGEPRIHFAIVCASVGCPRLLNEAYITEKLNQQLTTNTRDFFLRSQNIRVDAAAGTIYLSSILKWYGKDFGETQGERLANLTSDLPVAARSLIANKPRIRVEYLDYDWSLNDQALR